MNRPVTASATFCATLIDEWVRRGLSHCFVAPGSRSTPLALALADRPEIRLEIFHDERAASFAALGHGLASGQPAVVLCSSGTAGTHFHGAVVEASLSCVPLLVLTADRPAELIGVGAPQAIEQTDLYGDAPRLFLEPGCPEDTSTDSWRPLAARSWLAAVGADAAPGPVHLNLAFRDPLDGAPGDLPLGLSPIDNPERPPSTESARKTADLIAGQAGIVVAGAGLSNPHAVAELADSLGWPLLADQRSGLSRWPGAVTHGDLIARADPLSPEAILRFGEQPSSKALNQWIDGSGATIIVATPYGRSIDPGRVATFATGEAGLAEALTSIAPKVLPGDVEAWSDAETEIERIVAEYVAANPTTELAVARALAGLEDGTSLVLSSSMPIRQYEWFAGPTNATVFSNRGANGIDGVISTAIGVATTSGPTVCFLGDVALLHDSSSLVALSRRSIDLTIVVVDNDGGGIFSHLPQASSLPRPQFEVLFGTPHGTDIAALARAHGLPNQEWEDYLVNGRLPCPKGIHLVVARTSRPDSLEQQKSLVERVINHLVSQP